MTYDDEEILEKLRECYVEDGKVTTRSFNDFSGPCSATVANRFDSFNNALREAGVPVSDTWNQYGKEEIIGAVRDIAEQYNSVRPEYFGEPYPSRNQVEKHFDTLNKAAAEANCQKFLPDYTECKDCGGLYNHLGNHIEASSCIYPEFSDEEREILTGILLGDGSISENNQFFVSISGDSGEKFIPWLSEKISYPSTISVEKLPDENHSDVHTLRFSSHKFFKTLGSWYECGSKSYPENLYLHPETLRMWYVTDGSLNGSALITCWNESHRSDWLLSLFEEIGLDATLQESNNNIYIKKSSYHEFFDYMGEAPPGFKYKWPHGET